MQNKMHMYIIMLLQKHEKVSWFTHVKSTKHNIIHYNDMQHVLQDKTI